MRDQDSQQIPFSPVAILGRFALVTLFALVIGFFIPAVVANQSGVFYRDSLLSKLAHLQPDVAAALNQFEARNTRIQNSINSIDERIQADPSAVGAAAALRQEYQRELHESPPVIIQPLYLNLTMYFWPVMYIGLGAVAFIFRPVSGRSLAFVRRPGLALATSACLLIFNDWPLFLRTLGAKTLDRGRTVFAYSNPDISIASFVMQNANFLVFSILLAIIWLEWAELGTQQYQALSNPENSPLQVYSEATEQLSEALLRWQMNSLTVSIGFILYTAIFWDRIIVNGDKRFGIEAINAHVLWLVTLIFMSIPLFLVWHYSQKTKLRVLTELVNSVADPEVIKTKIEILREVKPIGFWNMTASGLTVLTSFTLPLLQALLKRGGH